MHECSLQFRSSGFKRLGKGPGESDNNIHSANWLLYLEQIESMNCQSERKARERALVGSVKSQMIWRRQIWIHFLFPCKKVEGIKGRVVRLNQDTSSQSVSAVEFSATGVSVCRGLSVSRKNSLLNNSILLNVRTHTLPLRSLSQKSQSHKSQDWGGVLGIV